MKTLKHKKSLTSLITGIVLFGIMLFTSENIFARTDKESCSNTPTKTVIENYKAGLKSDNDGVRKSCIYFAGKYKMTEVADILKEQFNDEKDPETSLLIVYALYQILEKDVFSGIDTENYFKIKYATIYE